jgi:hypothetical protein
LVGLGVLTSAVHYDHRAIPIYKAAFIRIEINPARFPGMLMADCPGSNCR